MILDIYTVLRYDQGESLTVALCFIRSDKKTLKSKILIIFSPRTNECIAKYLHDQLAPPLYFQIQLRSTAGGQNSNVNM